MLFFFVNTGIPFEDNIVWKKIIIFYAKLKRNTQHQNIKSTKAHQIHQKNEHTTTNQKKWGEQNSKIIYTVSYLNNNKGVLLCILCVKGGETKWKFFFGNMICKPYLEYLSWSLNIYPAFYPLIFATLAIEQSENSIFFWGKFSIKYECLFHEWNPGVWFKCSYIYISNRHIKSYTLNMINSQQTYFHHRPFPLSLTQLPLPTIADEKSINNISGRKMFCMFFFHHFLCTEHYSNNNK